MRVSRRYDELLKLYSHMESWARELAGELSECRAVLFENDERIKELEMNLKWAEEDKVSLNEEARKAVVTCSMKGIEIFSLEKKLAESLQENRKYKDEIRRLKRPTVTMKRRKGASQKKQQSSKRRKKRSLDQQ